MISLDIFADPICPWSYIGKAYLDRALEAEMDNPFQIRWRPFMLNPMMPREGMDRQAYMQKKFGNDQGILDAYQPVVEHAQTAGVKIDLPAIKRTPSTVDAHRLLHWAGIEERASFVADRLMKAYFSQGQDISDREVLIDIAIGAGMDGEMIGRLLDSDADRRDIVEQDASARGMGVTASPTFLVDGKHAVPGAQGTDMWRGVIQEIKQRG